MRSGSYGDAANHAADAFASRIDGQSGDVAERAARVIVVAVRVLRIPTAALLAVPVPFILTTILLAIIAGGPVGIVLGIGGVAMSALWGTFFVRRRRVLKAVDDPEKLATELGIMVALSDRVDEARGALAQIAGGGGSRVFSRLSGVWKGASMPARWIEEVGDLERARYFAPPKIGTTVTMTLAMMWLVPFSVVVAIFAVIGTLASTF